MEYFFLVLAPLRVVGQHIGSSINFALAIIDVKILAEQFLGLADLAGAQALSIHEPT